MYLPSSSLNAIFTFIPLLHPQDQTASMSNFVVTTPSLTAYPAHPTPGYVPTYGTTAMPSGLSHHHLWSATPNTAMSCSGDAVSVLDGSNVLRPSPFGYGKTAMMPTGSSCNGSIVKWVLSFFTLFYVHDLFTLMLISC